MPTVEPKGARVLVTGANGYIAMWVIRTLLEQGYTVRGVIRSLEKGKRLREYFSSYGDKLELFVVEDMMRDGAFDGAVKDVDAIEHMATPVTLTSIDPDEYIKPAIKGTIGVLESALKDKVKRIIITFSVTVIYNPVKEPTFTFDETHWGDEILELVKEKGKEAGPLIKYSASKTLAEKAAWEFYNTHKNSIKWDLVVPNPPFVLGPPLYEVKKPDDLNVSLLIFWNLMTKNVPDETLKDTYSFVDVHDISAAHVAVLRNEKAAGERIIIDNGNLIYSLHPKLYTSGILPRGNLNLDNTLLFKYNDEKGKRILGLNYTSQEKTILVLLADFEARGWLEKRGDA